MKRRGLKILLNPAGMFLTGALLGYFLFVRKVERQKVKKNLNEKIKD